MTRLPAMVLCVFLSAVSESAELFRHDDFQDGTTEDWSGGANPTNIPSGGPAAANDAYLLLTSNGTNGPGSRLGMLNNSSAWTGDYLSVGAQRIAVDMANFSMSELEMRVVLLGPEDDELRWTSTEAQVVPTGSTWSSYEFFLFESEMTRVDGMASYQSMIQDVFRVMIRHDGGLPSAGGDALAAQLGIDNVRLLPGGDFDRDGIVDSDDVNALVAQIASNGNSLEFDLDANGNVDLGDLSAWRRLAGLLRFGPGRSFLPGDANLDGVVDGLDFIQWNNHRFSNSPAWTSGDFNADGIVDGQDFIIWNDYKFMSSDYVVVPEPIPGMVFLTVAACSVALQSRRMRFERSPQSR